MIPGFHGFDLIVILLIALLIFGPKKLPEMGSSIGKTIKEFRKSMNELTQHKVDEEKKLPKEDEEKKLPVAKDSSKLGLGSIAYEDEMNAADAKSEFSNKESQIEH